MRIVGHNLCKLPRPAAVRLLAAIAAFGAIQLWGIPAAFAQGAGACARFLPGSAITPPPDLFSSSGVLKLNLSYQTALDPNGNTLFCYVLPDGQQSPTLHVKPGDRLQITLTNDTPNSTSSTAMQMQMSAASGSTCGAATMNDSSTNIHYHGTNTPPTCHQDEVIFTMINSGQSFTYDLPFPADEPAGLYWYHPHIHGLAEAAVQGGASGAIVVDGIENLQPKVAGLPQQLLIVRDNQVPGAPSGPSVPAWDISLNYVPIPFPNYPPAIIQMPAKQKQFWRVLNACAGTILDLQLLYDGKPQQLKIVALDGVPTGSQEGTRRGKIVNAKHILVPTAGRAEFIVVGPKRKVSSAILVTRAVNTGPDGDLDPARPIATIQTVATVGAARAMAIPAVSGPANKQRFEGLANAQVTANRKLIFSEFSTDPGDPNEGSVEFFITVDGQPRVLFDPNNPPAIITKQGSVEDWVVENRSLESHEFHIHQIHFLLLERNGKPVPKKEQQFLDTVDVPFWTRGQPFPNVKVRMDFRGPDIGDFVYHCHILEHEDGGMMATIRVNP
ncbi:MAG: multicopper oxidase domain-containing protein [Candidatus Binatus sp.]|uniref:multicopper oxidase family protein n=1 Tax=Candidatus Binatus sp. TaxID=2811406 RepID=UPI00271E2DE4|nr:multicopper oxidase domain-containing protein [Candidatus Binatus sp.]MDO8434345.1 multicopper oxidase domain-containing protein [Candidatus Binatus sp.]